MVRWVFSTVPTFNQCVDTGDRAYFGRKTLFGVAAAAAAALRCDASDGQPGGQAALRRSQPEILGQPAGGHGRRGGACGLSTDVHLYRAATLVFRSISGRCRPHHCRL